MIDWSLVIVLLRKHKWTHDRIAKTVGSDWQHIGRLARYEVAEPKFSVAVRLLDLAFDVLEPNEFSRIKFKEAA